MNKAKTPHFPGPIFTTQIEVNVSGGLFAGRLICSQTINFMQHAERTFVMTT